ncbi:hypothetical protein XELAEV_18038622mg [Xenopus laevis]|uniref:Uncharacterized protein n=1 Tax=Xenopus laevis TaxID=8355 RepID=A0A974C644_XENLA|nr:hypothetical protein XELAEV_18038622mg [Xenopus laevis]
MSVLLVWLLILGHPEQTMENCENEMFSPSTSLIKRRDLFKVHKVTRGGSLVMQLSSLGGGNDKNLHWISLACPASSWAWHLGLVGAIPVQSVVNNIVL